MTEEKEPEKKKKRKGWIWALPVAGVVAVAAYVAVQRSRKRQIEDPFETDPPTHV